MNNKEKHIKLKKIVVGEVIALLVVLNVVLVMRLDKACNFKVTKPVLESQSEAADPALQNAESAEQTQTQTAAQAEAAGTNQLEQDAKKLMDSMDEKIKILVNKDHKVPDDYKVSLVTYQKTGKKVADTIHDPLKQMLSDGTKQGLSFSICSAYRSNKVQENLFEKDKKKYMKQGMTEEEAIRETEKAVQPSGYSEHATGLAVDIVSKKNTKLNSSQEHTKEFQWLKENCANYGFILRYPDGKTDITGIIYEPWHFRYVGKEAAVFIMDNKLTYEEFYEMTHHE